jgi:hypothetical protein
MDLAQLAGLDYADVEIAGKTYRVGELTLLEWAPVQAWIKAEVPGPLASLGSPDFKKLPPDVKRDLYVQALEQDRLHWPPRIGTAPWVAALDKQAGGHAVLLLALLGKYQSMTLVACQAIADEAASEEILAAVLASLGMFGPKSPAPAEGPTTTTGAPKPTTSGRSPTSSSRRRGGRRTPSLG